MNSSRRPGNAVGAILLGALSAVFLPLGSLAGLRTNHRSLGGLQIMRPRMRLLFRLLMVLASAFIMAGCTGPQAKIRKVDLPKEKELRANWKNYNTYCWEAGMETWTWRTPCSFN